MEVCQISSYCSWIYSGNMRWLSSIFWPMYPNMNMVRPWRKIFVARNSIGVKGAAGQPSCPCNLETMLGKTKVVEGIYSMEGDFCRLRLNLSIIRRCQGDGSKSSLFPMGSSVEFFGRTKVRLSPWRISTVHICTWMRHPCFACQWLSSKLLSISSLNIKLMLPLPEQISTKSLRFGFSGKQPVQTLHSRKLGN